MPAEIHNINVLNVDFEDVNSNTGCLRNCYEEVPKEVKKKEMKLNLTLNTDSWTQWSQRYFVG